MSSEASPIAVQDPFCTSMWGEYVRLLLLGTAICSAASWAIQLGTEKTAPILVVSNLWVAACCVSSWQVGRWRLATLLVTASVLIYAMTVEGRPSTWFGPLLFFSPAVLLISIAVLIGRDCIMGFPKNPFRDPSAYNRQMTFKPREALPDDSNEMTGRSVARSYRFWGAVVFGAIFVGYMMVGPMTAMVAEQFVERPQSYELEDLTFAEHFRIRSAKFIVFLIFAYFGACVGSFLNVVAASLPKGESIVLRNSACPKCAVPIRRVDNFPIFSYLNLGGCCRSCGVGIPLRYLGVELIAGGIFATLFLVELVTGASNVPGFQHYHYTGIVWIILYTKWPVVGIYFYHSAMMCGLLTLALMERDRLRCPVWFAGALVILFAGLAILFPSLQPVRWSSHLPIQKDVLAAPVLSQLIACGMGAALGWGIAWVIRSVVGIRRSFQLPLGFALLGVALGWQAVIVVGVLYSLMMLLIFLSRSGRLLLHRNGATALLLVAALIHHPLWKTIDRMW